MIGFEENEISIKANGGTELAKRQLANLLNPDLLSNFQIVSSRARDIDDSKIRIFWAHDLPNDPESIKFRDVSFKDLWHKFVFVSNWQMQYYQLFHNIQMDDKLSVIETGIDVRSGYNINDILKKRKIDKINLVYTSTPQRGLAILIPVFIKLAEKYQNIHLHVYSSFKIYGWDEADKQFTGLYQKIIDHPQMTYHGFTPNDTLRKNLEDYHIFAYPSIWTETSCRSMLEAMLAGLICVHPNLGALPDTSGGLNIMYQYHENPAKHAEIFERNLDKIITEFTRFNMMDEVFINDRAEFNSNFIQNRYNIHLIEYKWEKMLKELLEQYPTVESRKRKSYFIYRTTD